MDPYEILGLKCPCKKEEIKQRYYELAKKHHPDKLSHLDEDEKKKHEEEFKKINVAYKLLNDVELKDTSETDWKNMWSYMDTFMNDPDMLNNMSHLLKNVIHIAREYKKQKGSEHFIKLEVTLEEVHQRKEKKLRLFLKGLIDPVFINIDCGCYPQFLYTYITPEEKTLFIHIEFILKNHDTFILDDLFDKYDLLTEIDINLYEYFVGCEKTITYLNGLPLIIKIPKLNINNVVIKNQGLFLKGDLRCVINIKLPIWDDFQKNDLKIYTNIVKCLLELYSQSIPV